MQMNGAESENGKHLNRRDAALRVCPVCLSHTDDKKAGRPAAARGATCLLPVVQVPERM